MLTDDELDALAGAYVPTSPRLTGDRRRRLHRLLEPLDQVTREWTSTNVARVRNTLLHRVYLDRRPYWDWDHAVWVDVAERAGKSTDSSRRGPVVAAAHALGLHRRLHHLVQVNEAWVAELVFGRDAVQAVVDEVVDTLRSWDSSRHTVSGQVIPPGEG